MLSDEEEDLLIVRTALPETDPHLLAALLALARSDVEPLTVTDGEPLGVCEPETVAVTL